MSVNIITKAVRLSIKLLKTNVSYQNTSSNIHMCVHGIEQTAEHSWLIGHMHI